MENAKIKKTKNALYVTLSNLLCVKDIRDITVIELCKEAGIKTVMTVVDGYPDYTLDIAACEKVARSLGAEFRVREWIKNGY